MRQRHVTWVDVEALRSAANRIDANAEIIDGAARSHLSRLAFGAASAGRAHITRGDALRAALDRLAGDLSQWSRASREIAVTLRAGADRYADAELRAATRLG